MSEFRGSSANNLAVSVSVEQSNSSSSYSANTAASRTNSQLTHAYVNAEVSQFGVNFRPFTPLYANSDEESVKELVSEKGSQFGSRSREGRGWSVVSSRSHVERLNNFANHHRQQPRHQLEEHQHHTQPDGRQRGRRAKSVSACSKFKVEPPLRMSLPRPKTYANNLSSVLMKPLPLPPCNVPPPTHNMVRSQPQLTILHLPPPLHTPPPPIESSTSEVLGLSDQCLFMDCSGDYTAPVPVSERYKYDPKTREMNSTVPTAGVPRQPFFLNDCHDYSDPDEPDHESQISGLQSSLLYNHLGEDVHPESSPSEQMTGFDGSRDEGLSSFGYSHGYVPTEVCMSIYVGIDRWIWENCIVIIMWELELLFSIWCVYTLYKGCSYYLLCLAIFSPSSPYFRSRGE